MRDLLTSLLAIGILLLVACLSLVNLMTGLLTGAIDGPARGADTVYAATRPGLFWTMVVAYLLTSGATAFAAYQCHRRMKS